MITLSPTSCAVILVNYNNYVYTLACLAALMHLTTAPAYVIVVDNGSCAEDVEALHSGWSTLCRAQKICEPIVILGHTKDLLDIPQRIFLCLAHNTGFAGGNNAALRLLLNHTSCSAFWLLNNDTEPQPEALSTLCERLNEYPSAGIAGSTLVYAHDKSRVQCAAGGSFSFYFGTTRPLCSDEDPSTVSSMIPQAVEQCLTHIIGASMLIRRDVFKKIGFFDEEFFLYVEETEFCIRAHKAGYLAAWAPKSIVYHHEGGTSGATSATGHRQFTRPVWVDYLGLRNRVYMMRKHYPWSVPLVLFSYLGVALKRIIRGQARRIPMILRAAWDGLTGRMGPPPSALK